MSSTDERIVKMQFDNADFKKAAADTQKSLSDVNRSVDAAGKGKGLLNLSSGMQQVGVSASKMAIVTTTALATIANKVVNVGINMVKSLTFDPLKQGFQEYESLLTKQNVIQNATGKSAKVVKGALNQLNHYSDKTIYSFGNMTDAIQKFVNAGVPLGTSVTTIKGIANAAAFAGASSEEANRAMYAFSQSMSLGFVQLQDWNQIENANLGTIKFKNSLLEAGVAAGTLTKRGKEYVTASGKTISATKGWRDGLQEQWATTKVLNSALGKYADTNTKLGRQAFKSAQEVRTFSAFMDTLKESIGSGWSQIFTSLIGNLGQSTKMWTGLSNAIGKVVNHFFNWTSSAIKVWRTMGGFEKTLQGFKNLLSPIGAIISVVGEALQTAFPGSNKGAGKALYGLSAGFAAITSPLQLLAKVIHGLTPGLTVFFQLIAIGGNLVGRAVDNVTAFVKGLLGAVHLKAPSSGGLMGWVISLGRVVGDTVGQINNLLHKGKSLGDALSSVKIKLPSMPSLSGIGNIFGGGAPDLGASSVDKASKPLAKIGKAVKAVSKGFKTMASDVKASGGTVKSIGVKMGEIFKKLGTVIGKFLKKIDFQDVISSFNMAVLTTFVISISRFLNTMSKSFQGFVGIGGSIKDVLGNTSVALKSFQTQARAKLILNIAIAIGILAASLWVLSKIPAKNLAVRLLALAGVFQLLKRATDSITKMVSAMDKAGTVPRLLALSVAIVAMAGAMLLMAGALILFNYVKWASIVKGLVVLRIMMVSLMQLGNLAKHSAGNMIAGAAAIVLISGSMAVLAGALIAFQFVKWESVGKAGAVLGGLTAAIAALALIPYEGIAKVGLALLASSVGMVAMATALIMFALVKWQSIGKAVVVLAALTISLAALIAVGGPASVSAMLGLAGAMVGLAVACLIFNKVNWGSIAKAAVVLTILIVALGVGATILTAFLYAIAPVSPVLTILAAGFALFGVGLLAFAGAMAIAIAVGTAGIAAFAALATGAAIAIAVFMQTLAAEAPVIKDSVLKILKAFIDTIVGAVPMIIDGVKRLWAAIMKELGSSDKGKKTGDIGKSWMSSLLDGVKKKIPELVDKAGEIIVKFIKALSSKGASIGAAATVLLARFIQGIANNIDKVTNAAINLIIRFAQGIAAGGPKMLNAGINMIAKFLHDLASAIRRGSSAIGSGLADVVDAFRDVGVNLIKGLLSGLESMADAPVEMVKNIIGKLPWWAKKLLHIQSPSKVFRAIGVFLVKGLTNGIQDTAGSAIRAVASMVSGQIAVANEFISGFIQKLDQQSIAARAKADGLMAAAQKADKAAKKTKTKTDDKAANRITKKANAADKKADQAESKAESAKKSQDRREQFQNATTLEKAQMRSEDAQNQLNAAKRAEARAAKEVVEARALDKQAKAKGVTDKQRKAFEKQADALRAQAKVDAKNANTQLANAKKSASDALAYQKKAGDEAAAAFQAAYLSDAKSAADAAAFDKLSDAEKAVERRKQADALQKQADADLAKAKKLAYTDLASANDLASRALDEAEQARQYLTDAIQFEQSTKDTSTTGQTSVINLQPVDAAAMAMAQFNDQYLASSAAAASDRTVQFTQYNTSPESLSPTEIYRNTNNLLTYAVDRLDDVA